MQTASVLHSISLMRYGAITRNGHNHAKQNDRYIGMVRSMSEITFTTQNATQHAATIAQHGVVCGDGGELQCWAVISCILVASKIMQLVVGLVRFPCVPLGICVCFDWYNISRICALSPS